MVISVNNEAPVVLGGHSSSQEFQDESAREVPRAETERRAADHARGSSLGAAQKLPAINLSQLVNWNKPIDAHEFREKARGVISSRRRNLRLAVRERSRNGGGENGSIEEITVQLKHPVGEARRVEQQPPPEAPQLSAAGPVSKTLPVAFETSRQTVVAPLAAARKSKRSTVAASQLQEPNKLSVLRSPVEHVSTPKKKHAMTS